MNISRADISISTEKNISFSTAPVFHGALMQMLPAEYSAKLHISELHPYTQHLERRGDEWHWVLTFLNEEASDNIWSKTLSGCDSIFLEHSENRIKLGKREYDVLPYKELNNIFQTECDSNIEYLNFISPTSFKQNGNYVMYPDLKLIYQSIMKKYSMSVQTEDMFDEDTLEQLCERSRIVAYNLKSCKFNLESIAIPAFTGRISIKCSGTSTMQKFLHMLLKFGTYSGVGIKTGLGMGAISIGREERKGDRKMS